MTDTQNRSPAIGSSRLRDPFLLRRLRRVSLELRLILALDLLVEHFRLTTPELRIQSTSINELFMGAAFCDLSFAQDDDQITIINRTQAVRYKK